MATVAAISQQIWDMKYRLKGPSGEPVDKTIEDTWRRVAAACAAPERDPAHWAARFYAARGFETIARAYLKEARYGYLRWGADGKVRQLDRLYPHLREEQPPEWREDARQHRDEAGLLGDAHDPEPERHDADQA